MTRVGILGGGQLCVMLAEALMRLDAEVVVVDPDPGSPARRRLPDVIVAGTDDAAALAALAARVDVITYEFENIAAPPLASLGAGVRFAPSVAVLQLAQDRRREKQFLVDHGFPCVPHVALPTLADLGDAATRLGRAAVLKTARGGYDGKGQYAISGAAELAGAAALREAEGGWVLEARVDLVAELSCIVARDAGGAEICFPPFENRHRDHVLDFTVVPARVEPATARRAEELALAIAAELDVVGLLTVEFFVTRDALYVNELAPRPHNSGHVTRRACSLSQFDALARVLVGAPLTAPSLVPGGHCMANLLGEVWLAQGAPDAALALDAWAEHPAVSEIYLYGKRDVREKRKMGHLIAGGADADEALRLASAARDALCRRR